MNASLETTEALTEASGSQAREDRHEIVADPDDVDSGPSGVTQPSPQTPDLVNLETRVDSRLVSNMLPSDSVHLPSTDETRHQVQVETPDGIMQTQGLFPAPLVHRGCELYFRHVSPFLSFIHQSTFDPADVPEALLMAILSVGLQFETQEVLGPDLPAQAFRRGKDLLSQSKLLEKCPFAKNIHTIQAYLLLEMYAAMYSGGQDTTIGLQMHHKSIEAS